MGMVATIVRGARSIRADVTLDGSPDKHFTAGTLEGGRGGSISLVGGESATYEEIYATQLWVQVVVNRLARSCSRLPIKVFVNPDEPAERQRVREGPLADLLKLPMRDPKKRMGPGEMKQAIVHNVALHGNYVQVKYRPRPGMPVTELLDSSFYYWDISEDTRGNTWYVFNPRNRPPMFFRPDEVLHYHWWRAGRGLKARSPLEAARRMLANEDATQRQTIASFENGVRPSGAFVVKGTLTKEQVDEQRAHLNEAYGGVDNAAKIAIVHGDADWKPMTHTFVESELIGLRKINREEAAALYNVPPPVVGILDRATFSNISEQHLMEYMDTMTPWTTMIEETLAVQLIAGELAMEGQYAEFDYNAVLQGDPNKRLELGVRVSGGAFMTANEFRGTQNLPPLDDPEADKLRAAPNASAAAQRGSINDSGN